MRCHWYFRSPGPVALAVNVTVLVVAVGFGEKAAVTPLGRPEALRVTLPLNPLIGTTVIVLVAVLAWTTVTELGFAVRLKFALPTGVTVRVTVVVCVSAPEVPVTVIVYVAEPPGM